MPAGCTCTAPQQSEHFAKGECMGPKGVGNPFLLVHTLRHLHPVSSRLGPKTSHAGLITACTACVSCLRKYPAASTGGQEKGVGGGGESGRQRGSRGERRGGAKERGAGCWPAHTQLGQLHKAAALTIRMNITQQ